MIDIDELTTLLTGALIERFNLTSERVKVTVTRIPPPNPGYLFEVMIDGQPAGPEIDDFIDNLAERGSEARKLS